MMWLYIVLIALVALLPLGWSSWRGSRLRSRQEAALALHRAQLQELDRDVAQRRILPAEHEAATLEIQRRLLAEANHPETQTTASSPLLLFTIACLVPAIALILYVADGTPDYAKLNQMATAQRDAIARANAEIGDQEMITRLQAKLATLDPKTEGARKGFVILGNAQVQLGRLPEAEEAFRKALAVRFDPTLGAETAEIITELQGHVTPEAAQLFKRALAEAPPNTPWRKDAEKRLAEAPP